MRWLFLLLLLPSLAHAGESLEHDALTVTLPGAELRPVSRSEAHAEALDARTGWTWRIDEVGDRTMSVYPEGLQVRDKIAARDGLGGLTDLAILPMGGGLGSLFGGATQTESTRHCFVGRGGSLWILTMRSSKAVIEQSEPALRAACKDAQFAGLPDLSPASAVGMVFDPRAPVDWLPYPTGGARAAAFAQTATDFSGVVAQVRREGHPYNTSDAAELRMALAKDGYSVVAADVMRAAGQDAPRFELTRTRRGGGEERWLMVVLRGEESLWIVQSPVRSMGYARLKALCDLALTNARLLER